MSSARTAPLKPKPGLSGPPVRAVETATEAGNVTQQIGKFGTVQLVYKGANGVTVIVETAGANAGKAITVFR